MSLTKHMIAVMAGETERMAHYTPEQAHKIAVACRDLMEAYRAAGDFEEAADLYKQFLWFEKIAAQK